MAFVVHGKFGVPLEGEDVVANAEALVMAEVAGGERFCAFRQLYHLIVVVYDKAQAAIGEVSAQLLVQDLRFADAHAPAAGKAFHTPAQRLRDELVPETDADKRNFLRCGLRNPLLQSLNLRQIVVGSIVGTRNEVKGFGLDLFGQFSVHHTIDVESEVRVDGSKQVEEHGFMARDAFRKQSGVCVAEQEADFLNCLWGHLTVI